MTRLWLTSILAICLAYFTFECFYVNYAAFVVDEFAFARQIYEYTFALPYRDFTPYKGVLGNYLLTPAFFLSHDMFAPLFYIKTQVALMNTACIAISAYWARRFFNDKAILISLLAILLNHQMLLLSADLRVDMLTSWVCLFACLALTGRQARLGGILIGIAFLISQKAIWYLFAINGALICSWLSVTNTQFRPRLFLQFNFYVATVIALYVVFWSMIATPAAVYQSLFYETYLQASMDWYLKIYLSCWLIALKHGPVLFLLWPLTFRPLFDRMPTQGLDRHIFIIVLGSLTLLQFIFYKQPFPYNFVFVAPVFFMLFSNYFSWLFDNGKKYKTILWLMIAGGILYPLIYSLIIFPIYNKNYQQSMMRIAAELTSDGSDYVAGTPVFYQKDQPINGMKNLIGPQIEYLYEPSEKLGLALLPSLYLAKTTAQEVVNQFEYYPVKVFINNQRTSYLPPLIANYLHDNFAHYYGSIDIYAPIVGERQLTFYLKFSGKYRIESTSTKPIKIDKHVHHAGNTIYLKRGDHLTSAKSSYRLVLVPDVKEDLRKDVNGEFIKAVIH